jgi:pimeloyl-ACP methyl ester carboxylesterase
MNAALTSDAVIYLPGIMGSELVNARGQVVWGMKPALLARQLIFRDVMKRLAPRPDDGITASRPLQLPLSVPGLGGLEPYTELDSRLRKTTLLPSAVLPFAFDWRHSIVDAAKALAPVARAHLADWKRQFAALPAERRAGRPEPRLTLVGHSMGGMVASWFATAMRDEGGDDVRLVVTLGTPFEGSVKALRVLASGDYLPLRLFADVLRDASRTMPGLYELLPTYACVDEGDADDGLPKPFRSLTPGDLTRVGSDPYLTAQAQETVKTLAASIDAEAGARIRCLVGTVQPTLQSVRFLPGGFYEFAETVVFGDVHRREDHRGDGTVFRYSAAPSGVQPSAYLPQSHGAIQKSSEGTQFVAAIVTDRRLGLYQAAEGIGLRVPELAVAGATFPVEVVDTDESVKCQLWNAETNRLVRTQTMVPSADGHQILDMNPPGPGTYRVKVAGTGFSPVEQLVLVAEPV